MDVAPHFASVVECWVCPDFVKVCGVLDESVKVVLPSVVSDCTNKTTLSQLESPPLTHVPFQVIPDPDVPEVPLTPGLPNPEDPEEPETPAAPSAPAVPDVPAVAEVPEAPAAPSAPAVPEVPEVPAVPEVAEVPEAPAAPSEPEVPDVPAVQEELIISQFADGGVSVLLSISEM